MLTIPGYELLNRLGGGLLTSVFAAREKSTDTQRAVKILRPDWEDQQTALRLLQREARAGLAVRHPHLVTVCNAHVLKPPYFLVMELLQGESLRRRLRRDYRLPIPQAVWIGRQIAEALAALHQAGFVHGDIKPDNIHLTADGNAVLLDLGFAHRPGENASILKKGYILGTVDYLSPELCAHPPADGPESDMYSLGVALFEMLSGCLPYPKGSIEQTILRHENEPPAKISRLVPSLPAALDKLVTRLLAKEASERPTIHSVVQQLIAMEIATLHHRRAA